MGFSEAEVPTALRLGNGNVERAVGYLTRDLYGLEDALINASSMPLMGMNSDNVVDSSVPEEDVEGAFPSNAMKKIDHQVFDRQMNIIYRKNEPLALCIQAAIDVCSNGLPEGDCAQFIERILPECVSRLVNPPSKFEIGEYTTQIFDCLSQCVSLAALRMKMRPPSKGLCRMLGEMLHPKSRYADYTSQRIDHTEYRTRISKGEWRSFCDRDALKSLMGGDAGRYAELLDQFGNEEGFRECAEHLMGDKLGLQDTCVLMRPFESFVQLLNRETMGEAVNEMVMVVCERLEAMTDKMIRDRDVRRSALELICVCEKLWSWVRDGLEDIMEADEVWGERVRRARLSFLLKCMRSSQLETRMYALDELGAVVNMLHTDSELCDERTLNKWLNQHEILAIVLSGNMDQCSYVDKMKPLMAHMTQLMNAKDIAFVWSLRKGRLGVSAANFVSVLLHVAARFDHTQMDMLIAHFDKCFDAKEFRMFERIFSYCTQIAACAQVDGMIEKMVACMWRLLERARELSHPIESAVRAHAKMIADARDGRIRDAYIRKAVDQLCGGQCTWLVSCVMYIRELLDIGAQQGSPKPSPKGGGGEGRTVTGTRMVTRLAKMSAGSAWDKNDESSESNRRSALAMWMREKGIVRVMISELIRAHEDAHSKESECAEFVIPGEDSLGGEVEECVDASMMAAKEAGYTYAQMLLHGLRAAEAVIQQRIVVVSWSDVSPLWTTLVASPVSAAFEKAHVFSWLQHLSVLCVETRRDMLAAFRTLPVEQLTTEGLSCFGHHVEYLRKNTGATTELLSSLCVLWRAALCPDCDLAAAAAGLLQTHLGETLLAKCSLLLQAMRSVYLSRRQMQASPFSVVTPTSTVTSVSPTPLQEVCADSTSCVDKQDESMEEGKVEEGKEAGEEQRVPADPVASGASGESSRPPATLAAAAAALDLGLKVSDGVPTCSEVAEWGDEQLQLAIQRVLELIARCVDKGYEQVKGQRLYPAHGTSTMGRLVRIMYKVEDDGIPSDACELISHANESIGQLRARIAYRLHFRNIRKFDLLVPSVSGAVGGEMHKEIECSPEWRTLEDVGVVERAEEDAACRSGGLFNDAKVSLLVRVKRGINFSPMRPTRSTVSEMQLPGMLIKRSKGVFEVLHELLAFENARVRQTARRLLDLLPSDDAIVALLTPRTPTKGVSPTPPASPDEVVETPALLPELDASRLAAELSPEQPYRLLYVMEELSARLLPVRLTTASVKSAGELAAAAKRAGLIDVLLSLVRDSHRIPPIPNADRTRIVELVVQVLSYLLTGDSALFAIVSNDQRAAQMLKRRHSAVDPLKFSKPPGYDVVSDLRVTRSPALLSPSEWCRVVGELRRVMWRVAAGAIKYSIEIRTEQAGGGGGEGEMNEAGDGAHVSPPTIVVSSSQPGCSFWSTSEPVECPAGASCQEMIRNQAAKALSPRETLLAGRVLSLMCDAMQIALNHTEGEGEQDKTLIAAMFGAHTDRMWLDLLVNSVTAGVRSACLVHVRGLVDWAMEEDGEEEEEEDKVPNCVELSVGVLDMMVRLRARLPFWNGGEGREEGKEKEGEGDEDEAMEVDGGDADAVVEVERKTDGLCARQCAQSEQFFTLFSKVVTGCEKEHVAEMLESEVSWLLARLAGGKGEGGGTAGAPRCDDLMSGHVGLLQSLVVATRPARRCVVGGRLILPLLEWLFPAKKGTGQEDGDEGREEAGEAGLDDDATLAARHSAIGVLAALAEGSIGLAHSIVDWLQERNRAGLQERESGAIAEWNYQPQLDGRRLGRVGLKNAGGTCYMNSVLQQMAAVPGLMGAVLGLRVPGDGKKAVENGEHGETEEDKQCALVLEVQRVMAQLAFSRNRFVVPEGMWSEFRFAEGGRLDTKKQHDAIDFMATLIDTVDTYLEKHSQPALFKPRLNSKFRYEYICYGCWHRYNGAEEDLSVVNLELHGESLEECLEHYVDGELLEGENAYRCEKCAEKRVTLRRGAFRSLPDTLCVQLKRFSYDMMGRQAQKNNQYLEFPLWLDMFPYTGEARATADEELEELFEEIVEASGVGSHEQSSPSALSAPSPVPRVSQLAERFDRAVGGSPRPPDKNRRRRRVSTMPSQQQREECGFELVGVVAHSGIAAAGHYYSYVRERRDELRDSPHFGRWFEVNDTRVEEFDVDDVETVKHQWFGGQFIADKGECRTSCGVELPSERTRNWNAYVLVYQRSKRDTKNHFTPVAESTLSVAAAPSLRREMRASMPDWLRDEMHTDNERFDKDGEMFAVDYGRVMCDVGGAVAKELERRAEAKLLNESDDSLASGPMARQPEDNTEVDAKAVGVFKVLVSYCERVLWRVCGDVREEGLMRAAQHALKGIIQGVDGAAEYFADYLFDKGGDELFSALLLHSPPDVRDCAWHCWTAAATEWANKWSEGAGSVGGGASAEELAQSGVGRGVHAMVDMLKWVRLNQPCYATGAPILRAMLAVMSAGSACVGLCVEWNMFDAAAEFLLEYNAHTDSYSLRFFYDADNRDCVQAVACCVEMCTRVIGQAVRERRHVALDLYDSIDMHRWLVQVCLNMAEQTRGREKTVYAAARRCYRAVAELGDEWRSRVADMLLRVLTDRTSTPAVLGRAMRFYARVLVEDEFGEMPMEEGSSEEEYAEDCERWADMLDAMEYAAASDCSLHYGLLPQLEEWLTSEEQCKRAAQLVERIDAICTVYPSLTTCLSSPGRADRWKAIRLRIDEWEMARRGDDRSGSSFSWNHGSSGNDAQLSGDVVELERRAVDHVANTFGAAEQSFQ